MDFKGKRYYQLNSKILDNNPYPWSLYLMNYYKREKITYIFLRSRKYVVQIRLKQKTVVLTRFNSSTYATREKNRSTYET